MCDEDGSLSLVSTVPDVETIYTPSDTDALTEADFELLSLEDDQQNQSSDLASSCSTSLLPVVHEHEYLHGRRYHGYKKGRYPLPNDSLEQQKEETLHALMLQLTKGQLIFADIGEYPQKIIDIGTGTGTWAIDVADLYSSASVVGTDLSPIQPTWLPINVRMFVEDCEEPEWLHGSEYDLVHFRGMASSVLDLDGLLAKVYPQIKEGGWVEFQEFTPQILCDDYTMKDDDALAAFAELSLQGMQKLGFASFDGDTLQDALERAGFANIQCVTKKVPISTWARGRQLQTVGVFMKGVLQDAIPAYAAKPLAALDIPAEKRRALAAQARESLENDRIHRYVKCVFCYGQKDVLVSDSDSYY